MAEVALNNSQYFYQPQNEKSKNKPSEKTPPKTEIPNDDNVVKIPESSVYAPKAKAQTPPPQQPLPPLPPQNSGMMSPLAVYGTIAAVGAIGLGVICHKTKGLDKINKLLAKGEPENASEAAEKGVKRIMTPKFKDMSKADDVTSLDNLSGLDEIKEAVGDYETFFTNPEHFEGWRLEQPPNRLLMWGPGGTGKTTAAEGLAKKLKADFISLRVTDFDSEYQSLGARQFEELLNKIDQYAIEHPDKKVVLFMDECDSIIGSDTGNNVSHGQQLMNVLKEKLEGDFRKRKNLLVIGATNKSPDGRFADNSGIKLNGPLVSRFKAVEISVPNKDAIKDNLRSLFNRKKIEGNVLFDDDLLKQLAKQCAEMKMTYRQIRDCFESFVARTAKLEEQTAMDYKKVFYKVLSENENIGKDPWTLRTLFTENGKTAIDKKAKEYIDLCQSPDIAAIEKEVEKESGATVKEAAMKKIKDALGIKS